MTIITDPPIDSPNHPLYLHPNDHPGLILIAKKLTGSENYSSWKRSMTIALNAKNKLKIVTGDYSEPALTSELRPLWERTNDMVAVSFAKINLSALRPRVEELGRLPGTDIFCEVDQYTVAHAVAGVLIIRLNSGLLCFTNANPLRNRILKWVTEDREKEAMKTPITGVILDMSSVTNIDYAGIIALEETNKKLLSEGIKLVITSPKWRVIHKLKLSKFVDKVGRDCIFLTVSEAVDSLGSS